MQYNGASVATCTTTRADVEICPSVLLKVLHSLHVLELVLLLPAVHACTSTRDNAIPCLYEQCVLTPVSLLMRQCLCC